MSKNVAVRRGRPSVFNATAEKAVVNLLKKLGATGTKHHLETVGVRNGTAKNEPVSVCIPTLCNIAKRNGVELTRGRPVGTGKAEEPAPVKAKAKSKGKGKKKAAAKRVKVAEPVIEAQIPSAEVAEVPAA